MGDLAEIRGAVEEAWERRDGVSDAEVAALLPELEAGLAALNAGRLRAAVPEGEGWSIRSWVQKLILLYIRFQAPSVSDPIPGMPRNYDKVALKFEGWSAAEFQDSGVRVAPGAVVRTGCYVGRGSILMPSFVNIGAYVGSGTTVDTWATIGFCAQIGDRCHISGGAGIGGVLEPIGTRPVIVEDGVFVGARSEIAEGVWVRRGAVIGMGVYLGASTPIIDRATAAVTYGEVPENAVVISGMRLDPNHPGIGVAAAIIIKSADEKTRAKTSINSLLRP